jgi:glutaredoxin
MTTVTLYGKAGCCLCDEAKAVIQGVRADYDFELREVDVSTDPVLNNRYGERIPVVEVDGDELSEYAIDPVEFRTRLDTVVP